MVLILFFVIAYVIWRLWWLGVVFWCYVHT